MPACPDHPRELVAGTNGKTCPHCKGTLMGAAELEALVPHSEALLEPEARSDALPFKKRRACPECGETMVPLRIGRLEAWVERCPSCELLWVESADVASLKLVTKSVARQEAWQSIDASTRAEMAKDLAEHGAPKVELPVQPLSIGETAQVMVGVPLLQSLEGAQRPWGTLASLALIAIVFGLGLFDPAQLGFDALGFRPGADGWWKALVAVFAHDGWVHVLGNLGFGLVFGDAVERKSPRWVVPAMLFGGGALSLVVDGWTSAPESILGGASGGVFGLMGLTAVLQRQGRWLVPLLGFTAIRLPLPFVMLVYAGLDVWIASELGGGIAWVAHASGFAAGLLLGVALHFHQARVD